MNIDACYELGYIMRTHGIEGEVVFLLDVDEPELYEELDSVFIEINQALVPYFIDDIRIQKDKAIVQLEDVTCIESAEKLVGCALYLPLDNLPALEEDQFYYHQIVDYQVVDRQKGRLGVVTNVYELPQQDIIAMNYQEKEVLIPINDVMLTGVDHKRKEVYVDLPDGLLEIYLDDDKNRDGKEEEES